jgi:transketolase
VILIGTGSEVQYVVEAQKLLAEEVLRRELFRCPVGSGSTSRIRAIRTP